MTPTKKHYAYQWAEKKFCGKPCKEKAAVQDRTRKRVSLRDAAQKRISANKSRVMAMKKIAELIRRPWTKAWYE